MLELNNKQFDEERALYGSDGIILRGCIFDGPADGESALKESQNIESVDCIYNLRYPFWHDKNVQITAGEMTEKCRAAIWYSDAVKISGTIMRGIKAIRECTNVSLKNCCIVSPEFGWSLHHIRADNCTLSSEYALMRSSDLYFEDDKVEGKYAFQYIENAYFNNCLIDTKDAFWHARNVIVKNSRISGEYLAWYSDSITFDHCIISGTQPLCYCKNLKLIECRMNDTDLSFEKSDVEATLTAPIVSIKNPHSGIIHVPDVGQIIMDDPAAKGRIELKPSAHHYLCGQNKR